MILRRIRRPNGTFVAPPGVTTSLLQTGARYRLEERFGTVTVFDDQRRIESLTDVDANRMSFTYEGDKLKTVTDSVGRRLTLNYVNDRLSSITDPTARFVSYSYLGQDLTSFFDPDGKFWQYSYQDSTSHRMTALIDPLNIILAANTYNALGDVITQTVPRDNNTTATYKFFVTTQVDRKLVYSEYYKKFD